MVTTVRDPITSIASKTSPDGRQRTDKTIETNGATAPNSKGKPNILTTAEDHTVARTDLATEDEAEPLADEQR